MTDCNVIADLIPLYIDNTCSKESSELIEEHIKTCESCTKLLQTMRTEGIEPKGKAPKLESKRLFESVRKSLLIVMLSLGVMVACYCFNYFGFYYFEHSLELLFTVIYIAAWAILSVYVKEIIPLIIVNLSFASITLAFGIIHYARRILLLTDIITAGQYVKFSDQQFMSSIFYLISVPYCGVARVFPGWIYVYIASSIVSLAVVIYSIISLKNWKKYRS